MARNIKDPDKPTVLTTKEARQGETTGRMRKVLLFSLLLAVIVGIGFAVYYT
jgi:hypothetical protein